MSTLSENPKTTPSRLHSERFDTAVAFHDLLRARFEELLADVDRLATAYRQGEPVPHIVMDDFLPTSLARALVSEFPAPDSTTWNALPTADQRNKRSTREDAAIPALSRSVLMHLNSGMFVQFLERLTGTPELIVDTKLAGGGLHRIDRGGKLSVHIDFSHHPNNGLHRRLNLLLYLNPDWDESWGGNFELWRWKDDDKRPLVSIAPVFNRCVVFSTSPDSWHGHPAPLETPEGVSRKSVALYYFSNGRDDHGDVEHNTIFRSRPGEDADLATRFVRWASSGGARDVIPPILYRTIRRVWNERFTVQR